MNELHKNTINSKIRGVYNVWKMATNLSFFTTYYIKIFIFQSTVYK